MCVADDVTGVLLGHLRFSSITSDRIEIKGRERHHCARTELTNMMMTNMKTDMQLDPPISIRDLRG